MSMNVTGSTQLTGTQWVQNMKSQKSVEQTTGETRLPVSDSVTISKEGIEHLRNSGKAKSYTDAMQQKASLSQASKSIGADYGYRLSKEAGILKGQRDSGTAYNLSDRASDYVQAYGTLYDEIVQGYKDGSIERYVEDETSETGFRRLTMEEDLAELDKAFQGVADKTEIDAKASRILAEHKEKLSKLKSGQSLSANTAQAADVQENVSQKLVTLMQAWKDTYKVSNSKTDCMTKVLSMLNSMFGIKNET